MTFALSTIVVLEALWAMRAAYRLHRLYSARLTESEFFRRLVARDRLVAFIGGGAIATVVVWNLLAWSLPELVPQIPRPWGSIFIGIALMVMLWGPIADERYISHIRKGKGDAQAN